MVPVRQLRPYLDAAGKDDHLLGLDVFEAVDAGDAISDGEDAARLVKVCAGAAAKNFLLDDRGDFR